MEEIEAKNRELSIEARSIAKSMLKKGKEEVEKRLPEYLSKNVPLGVAICKELIEITKDSIKGKSENQKAFIALCNKVIESCDNALKDGNISEEERLILQRRIDDILQKADKSNKQYQKDKRDIAIAGVGGLTLVGLVGIIASALIKSKKP